MKSRKGSHPNSGPVATLLAAPTPVGLIDTGDGVHFIMPADQQNQRLEFDVPLWPNSNPDPVNTETLTDFWNEDPTGSVEFGTPPGAGELRRFIATNRFGEDTFDLWYQVTFKDQAPMASERLKIIIDQTSPVLDTPNSLQFSDVPAEGITSEYLDSKGGVLPATLNYTQAEAGDVVTVFWDTADNDDNVAHSRTIVTGEVGSPILLDIPARAIEDSGDGQRKVRYRIADRAGNESVFSDYVELKVALKDDEDESRMDPPAVYPEDLFDAADGTLTRAVVVAEQGLRVLIPAWTNLPGPGFTDMIYLNWADGHDQANAEYELAAMLPVTGPIAPEDFPIQMIIPHNFLLPDGPFLVNYGVQIWTGDPPEFSKPLPLISDITPPWGTKDPAAAIVPAADITDDYFTANPEGVKWSVPAYDEFKPGDHGYFWWLNTLPEDVTGLQPTGEFDVTEVPLELVVPKAAVDATGDGGCYLVYVLFDKVGNQSKLSIAKRVKVALGPLPTALSPPEFPQAVADGVIDLLDAYAGAIVAIPEFDNVKPTDGVRITWGGITTMIEEVGLVPEWPRRLRIPDSVLKNVYGDAEGPVTTVVSYVIYRGDVIFGPETANVEVDLSVAGPDLPDWPDLVNGDLKLGEAMGATSQTLNVLDRRDTLQDATFSFPMYAGPAAGEVVRVYWGDVLAGTYDVQGTEVEGDPIPVTIPWAVIEQVGNNAALNVHYRIGTANSPNEQRSGMTVVSVDAVVLIPEAPVFLHLKGPNGDILTCGSLVKPDNSVEVEVPDLSRWLAAGDTVTLKWTPYDDKGGAELTDAILEQPIVLEPGQVKGFVWQVKPYERHILPTYESQTNQSGWATATYSFPFEGHTATSAPAEAEVHMYNAGGSCQLS